MQGLIWEWGGDQTATGTPPWASSTDNQGRGEDPALPHSGPAAFSKDRTAFRGRMNICLFLAPSEV